MNPPEFESANTNNPQPNPYNQNQFGGQQTVPNSVGVLVLGILSIVFCWCYGILAIILGIIALVLAGQGEKAYMANQQAYTLASYKNLRAGKICAIVGLSLGAVYIIVLVVYFIIAGTFALGAFNGLKF
jgi:hypothetical protein